MTRVCHCVGMTSNPGGACCMDLNQNSPDIGESAWVERTFTAPAPTYLYQCVLCGMPADRRIVHTCVEIAPEPTLTEERIREIFQEELDKALKRIGLSRVR